MRHVFFLWYVLEASLMTIPWDRNMQLNDLFYKVVFDGYLFIPYFTVRHNRTHNLKENNG
jgi:hypothetical protein